jgi:hypothetical protein
MIVYDLICGAEHRFEAWFGSLEDFERQAGTPLLACPVCGNADVKRLPSGIHTARSGRTEPAAPAPAGDPGQAAAIPDPRQVFEALRKFIDGTENVGDKFPEEARRIHYGEVPGRSIRGHASPDEAEALRDEGIEVLSLPLPPVDDLH